MGFKENFRKLRIENGYTQLGIAEIVNVDKTTVGKWVQIGTVPSEDTLKKLCDIFDVTLDYLLGRTNTPTPTPTPSKQEEFFRGLGELELERYKNLTDEDKTLLAQQFNALIDRLEGKNK